MTWRPPRISPSRSTELIRDPHTCASRSPKSPNCGYGKSEAADLDIAARSSPGRALLHGRLPVAAVERFRRERGEVDVVEAARVDVDLVGIGARHVERMHAAVPAEGVLGGAGVELVGGEIVLAAEELEALA